MLNRSRKEIQTYRAPAAFFLGFLLLWEVMVRLFAVPDFILPPPSQVGVALLENARVLFTVHLPATLLEIALGLGISLVLGVGLAVGMNFSPLMERIFYPLTVVSQTVPVIALSPVFVLWFGYTIWSKVAITVLIAFFPIVVNTYDGFRGSNREYMELLQTMGATRWQVFMKSQVHAALPMFFSGLKVAAVASVIGATVGEWLSANEGLGYFSRRMANSVRAAPMFAAIVVLSLLGVALFALIQLLERRLLHWYHRGSKDR